MALSGFIRSPFTDLTGDLVSHQLLDRCADRELRYMDCMEAYGMGRGREKCKELLANFMECHTLNKQFRRFVAMRKERERQIRDGTLKGDERYVTPVIDSY